MYKYLLLLIIPTLILNSCKKPSSGCEVDEQRCAILTGHTWQIDSLIMYGGDSLPSFMFHPTYCEQYNFKIISGNYYFTGQNCNGNAPSHQYGGSWTFYGNIISFNLSYSTNEYYNSVFYGGSWIIEFIDNEKLWLKTKNNEYELHFKAL